MLFTLDLNTQQQTITPTNNVVHSGWDPCGDYYPTCSPGSTDDDYEGPCEFHANIMTQNCTVQYMWFKEVLKCYIIELLENEFK
jgi:hypothetical protein